MLVNLQVKDEVRAGLDFINYVYGKFGFSFELKLSTVGKSYLIFYFIFFIFLYQ